MRRLALIALAACGGEPAAPDSAFDDILPQLEALPGVTVSPAPTENAGRYYVLHFTQPVDHDDPTGPTFQQEVSLLHRDTSLPLIVVTDGYWDFVLDQPGELAGVLGANQISIEHRFFAPSIPDAPDWSKDTIAQMAADEHAIVTALATIYPGPKIATGESKGGMTAVYYRRFFPDDVTATVAYVAPEMFAVPDTRFDGFFDTIGDTACRDQVRAVATEMLANRRAALAGRALMKGNSYKRVQLGPAVEIAVASLEWAFWQYFGDPQCGNVPPTNASDDDLFTFLETVSPVEQSDDDQCAAFEPWMFQAYSQLGYPDDPTPYLSLMYTAADYDGVFPNSTVPTFDGGTAMHDIDDFVQHGERLMFVYGEWDPWNGAEFTLGSATDSMLAVAPQGTHHSGITNLVPADRDAAFAKLAAWTGVTPHPTAAVRVTPPPLFRAMRVR